MRNYPNIEPSGFTPGAYVGYGGEAVWSITKVSGGWLAIPRQADAPEGVRQLRLRSLTLILLSVALERVAS